MFQEFKGVEIKSISTCVPSRKIPNSFFGELLSTKEVRVFEKTVGILERRWAEESVTASDLGYAAAVDLLEKYNLAKDEIDCLIFLSQTSDFKIPFTSNILQSRLGLKKDILCLDINAGCAGFIQGLSTSFSIVKTIKKGKVLFIVAETLSKILSTRDRSTSMLFGDGAAAILIENTENDRVQSFFNFFSDGLNADAIKILDGGYRNGLNEKSLELFIDENGSQKTRLQLSMDGPKVFDFTLREIAPSIQNLLHKFQFNLAEVDFFLFHQSNKFIINQISSQLDISKEKVLINIEEFGNTSGVSIPLLFNSCKGKMYTKNNLLLSGYGVGLNWGNCFLKNSSISINDLIQI